MFGVSSPSESGSYLDRGCTLSALLVVALVTVVFGFWWFCGGGGGGGGAGEVGVFGLGLFWEDGGGGVGEVGVVGTSKLPDSILALALANLSLSSVNRMVVYPLVLLETVICESSRRPSSFPQ